MTLSIEDATHLALPMIALILGLGGGLHCAGMFGPLVISVAPTKKTNALYQLGRLFGYLALCFAVSLIGRSALETISPQLHLWFSILIGALFLVVGVALITGKAFHTWSPKWGAKAFQKSTQFFLKPTMNPNGRAFGVGLSSIFLPCALLYGVVFSLIASHGLYWAVLSITMFWIGTLPAMLLAPVTLKKILRPLIEKAPRLAGTLCIMAGLFTLYYRFVLNSAPGHSCH